MDSQMDVLVNVLALSNWLSFYAGVLHEYDVPLVELIDSTEIPSLDPEDFAELAAPAAFPELHRY